jgi:hypothetical protein
MVVTILLVTVLALAFLEKMPTAAALDAGTRISNFQASESGGIATITGTLQYRNASGDFRPLNSSKVKLYWWVQGSAITNYVGEVYSNDKTASHPGAFVYQWVHQLEPGTYYVTGKFEGDSWGGYTFDSCEENTQLAVRLRLRISLDNPTASIAQGDSLTVQVTVGAINTNAPHSVTLSTKNPTQLFASETFSPVTGNTPFVSKLTLNVLNVTQPGTYTVTVAAQSEEDSSVTATANLILLVQQSTYTITVEIQGLPSDVETSISLDGTLIQTTGTGIVTLTISNKTKTISVSKEITSGDTLYLCTDDSKVTDTTADSFVFNYVTEYRLKISGDLPQDVVCKLILKIGDTDQTNDQFKPTEGYNSFLPQNTQVSFGIVPDYITTSEVNYKFTEWKEQFTGEILTVSNATSDGLYVINLNAPYDLRAYYEKWATVTIRTNLPSELSTKLEVGLIGSEQKPITVVGSVAFSAGEFLVGAAFECSINQDQLVLYNTAGNTRYEFQGMTPSAPITLEKHTTIVLNYATEYRVQVISKFSDTTLQPSGGVGWYSPGQIATLEVRPDAKDKNGIMYLFQGWTGGISSNKTLVSFVVAVPIDAEVQWGVNWAYLLTVAGGALGIAAPTALVVKKKVLSKKSKVQKKKVPKVGKEITKGDLTGDDMKIYRYISQRGGAIKLGDAAEELSMSKEQIRDSIVRLRESQMLR